MCTCIRVYMVRACLYIYVYSSISLLNQLLSRYTFNQTNTHIDQLVKDTYGRLILLECIYYCILLVADRFRQRIVLLFYEMITVRDTFFTLFVNKKHSNLLWFFESRLKDYI